MEWSKACRRKSVCNAVNVRERHHHLHCHDDDQGLFLETLKAPRSRLLSGPLILQQEVHYHHEEEDYHDDYDDHDDHDDGDDHDDYDKFRDEYDHEWFCQKLLSISGKINKKYSFNLTLEFS